MNLISVSLADDNVKKAADNLWDDSDLHVKIIEACTECFERQMKDRKNYLTDACTIPHLLVYVQMEAYPIWPGKLISIDGEKAHILFFGDHNQADIELKDCFLYSEHFHSKTSKNRNLNLAIRVILLVYFDGKCEFSEYLFVFFLRFVFRKQRLISKKSRKNLVGSIRPIKRWYWPATTQVLWTWK